jgi:tRNA G18 (ribose-2'-O)-methylase SpoU
MRKLQLHELGRKSLEEYRTMNKNSMVIVLDNIRSAMNVGSFFRTADAFALERILLCGITAQPPHKEINKTAIGADRSVAWQHFPDILHAINGLKQEGYRIIGLEQTNSSTLLQSFSPQKDTKYALVFGNEVTGLSDQILELLDECLEIPQFGTKHSLNVAVSGGVAIWHFMLAKLDES